MNNETTTTQEGQDFLPPFLFFKFSTQRDRDTERPKHREILEFENS